MHYPTSDSDPLGVILRTAAKAVRLTGGRRLRHQLIPHEPAETIPTRPGTSPG